MKLGVSDAFSPGAPPAGLTGVQAYPLLFAELIRRGWSDKDLAALAGGNVLRALRGAEATAAALRNQPAAMDKQPATP